MKNPHRVIGVDESGKGDFFGPLVIASFLADDSDLVLLKALGVRDGKSISDKRILEIDGDLRADFSHSVIVVPPKEYNRRYKKTKNLNKLLADGHAEAIDRLLSIHPAEMAISDKFGKTELVENALKHKRRSVKLEQIVRGESIPQVAAASILARARFIQEMDGLSAKYGMALPRGAAAVVDQAGRELVRLFGADVLMDAAKIHFKNYHRIVNPTLF
ncbi:MAG: ribonuclease HIII [Candidatus Zixiibacteriota bacterium]|nr:MAG: ribonuclease HIII [candidate division Zixibacteria bacterium]